MCTILPHAAVRRRTASDPFAPGAKTMRRRTASDAAAREIQVCITATSHCTHGFSTICLMFTRQNLNIYCAKEPTGSPHPIYREHGRFSAAAAKNRTSPSGKRRTANRVHGHQAYHCVSRKCHTAATKADTTQTPTPTASNKKCIKTQRVCLLWILHYLHLYLNDPFVCELGRTNRCILSRHNEIEKTTGLDRF